MKIGVITLWDSQENYGQILQAYALQVVLKNQGHDTFLIRYDKSRSVNKHKSSLPQKLLTINYAKLFDRKALKNKLNALYAGIAKAPDRGFDRFRSEYLTSSSKCYTSPEELQQDPPEADVYISGSDQVWNYSFIGDFRPFFLQFGKPGALRISYAASFGHRQLPEEVEKQYQRYLQHFDQISVRERSGVDLCETMGRTAQLLPDPTVLPDRTFWQKLSKPTHAFASARNQKIFIYTLGNRPSEAKEQLFSYLSDLPEKTIAHVSIHKDLSGDKYPSLEEWLGYFDDCDLVITNSFHGMLFSVLFNKNFIGLPCKGNNAGMNERLITLMTRFGLEDHLLYEFDENQVNKLAEKQIDWKRINAGLDAWRDKAGDFLKAIELGKYSTLSTA